MQWNCELRPFSKSVNNGVTTRIGPGYDATDLRQMRLNIYFIPDELGAFEIDSSLF